MDDTTGRLTTPRASDDPDVRTQEIRDEIAQTRVEMSETIEAIQERLTPGHLVAQAGETVRNAATEKVKDMANRAGYAVDQLRDSSFVETVRSNPIPAVMIGIGAAWLAMKGRTPRGRSYRDYGTRNSANRDWSTANDPELAVGTSGYGEYGSGARSEPARAAEFGRDVRSYGGGRPGGFERVVRDNPLAIGAAAALVGVAIGLSVPETETENQLMGEARDSVVDRARDLASDAAQKVQEVAVNATDAAQKVQDPAGKTSRESSRTPLS